VNLSRRESVEYLQRIMSGNKARGLIAQLEFERWVQTQSDTVRNKHFPGGWIVALKRQDFYALRTCFFVWPDIETPENLQETVRGFTGNAQFQRLCSSLQTAGFDTLYCFGTSSDSSPRIGSVRWRAFHYENEGLIELDQRAYFGHWSGRGRESRGREWEAGTLSYVRGLDDLSLSRLVIPQLFYNGFFKAVHRASTADPYDVDGFVVSYDGKVFPLELKEKFPFEHNLLGRAVGVDVGRILMLLRICLPIDANAMYIVREVDDSADRHLVGWKSVYLDEILMKCTWQQMGGGPGMASSAGGAGSPTSTIIMPHHIFAPLTEGLFSDVSLRMHATLTESTKRSALEFIQKSRTVFGSTSGTPSVS
jgi:hypothetical protein